MTTLFQYVKKHPGGIVWETTSPGAKYGMPCRLGGYQVGSTKPEVMAIRSTKTWTESVEKPCRMKLVWRQAVGELWLYTDVNGYWAGEKVPRWERAVSIPEEVREELIRDYGPLQSAFDKALDGLKKSKQASRYKESATRYFLSGKNSEKIYISTVAANRLKKAWTVVGDGTDERHCLSSAAVWLIKNHGAKI